MDNEDAKNCLARGCEDAIMLLNKIMAERELDERDDNVLSSVVYLLEEALDEALT